MKTASFRFSVCPHDTAKNLAGWFLLNTYLQRRLNCAIHFEPSDNFDQERETVLRGGYHIVYANPYSAVVFAKTLGFVPIAKAINAFDETLLIARRGVDLSDARSLRVAVATNRLVVYILGLSLLGAQNISQAQCEFAFVGTHPKAAQAVAEERADLAFVYHDTWHALSATLRGGLEIVAQTNSHLAFHCFGVAPEWQDRRAQVQATLCEMKDDPQGRSILRDLHFEGFEPLAPDALDALQTVFEKVSFR